MRSKEAIIPHIAIPFDFIQQGVGGVNVNEQDSLDDVYDCVQAIMRTETGFRPELPAFGIADQTFTQGEIDLPQIKDDVSTWEPRSDVLYEQSLEGFDLMEDLVRARVARISPTGGSSA